MPIKVMVLFILISFAADQAFAEQQDDASGAVTLGRFSITTSVFTNEHLDSYRLYQERALQFVAHAPVIDRPQLEFHLTGVIPVEKSAESMLPIFTEKRIVDKHVRAKVSAGFTVRF
ncbi:MAG: hypothetical protein JWL88_378 [Parcubacteria group bacterium]|nr:hypothetical protein [Parcubacteria group bacterium]